MSCHDKKCTRGYDHHAPKFIITAGVSCEKYHEWLENKAANAEKSETIKKEWKISAKQAIHTAVENHGEFDYYTGEKILWSKINRPHTEPPGKGWKAHKKRGYDPTADHVNGTESRDFRICSSRVNSAKAALTHTEFVQLCEAVVKHDKATGGKRKSK